MITFDYRTPIGVIAPIGAIAPGCDKNSRKENFKTRSHPDAITRIMTVDHQRGSHQSEVFNITVLKEPSPTTKENAHAKQNRTQITFVGRNRPPPRLEQTPNPSPKPPPPPASWPLSTPSGLPNHSTGPRLWKFPVRLRRVPSVSSVASCDTKKYK